MDARTAIINAALEYRIEVLLRPDDLLPDPRGFNYGPLGGAGINFRRNALVVDHNASPEDMLHEMAHLVVGRPSTWLSEGYVLMPFEWELAKHLAKRIDQRERKRFMRRVREYQDCTEIGRFHMCLAEFGPGVRRTKWWRQGLERARRLKLLHTDNTPTFLSAEWEGSGVPKQARTWTPDT